MVLSLTPQSWLIYWLCYSHPLSSRTTRRIVSDFHRSPGPYIRPQLSIMLVGSFQHPEYQMENNTNIYARKWKIVFRNVSRCRCGNRFPELPAVPATTAVVEVTRVTLASQSQSVVPMNFPFTQKSSQPSQVLETIGCWPPLFSSTRGLSGHVPVRLRLKSVYSVVFCLCVVFFPLRILPCRHLGCARDCPSTQSFFLSLFFSYRSAT